MFSLDRPKIGMCGDGANDLLALKEADLSLGMHGTDAGLASNFTIQNLIDVDAVLRESKSNICSIMQLFSYVSSVFIASRMFYIALNSNAADISRKSRVFYNFISIILLFLFLLSKPVKNPSKYVPQANFMKKYNQLVIYGNSFIMLLHMVISYIYFKTTDNFHLTEKTSITLEEGYTRDGTDAALFIILNITWTWASLTMYWG